MFYHIDGNLIFQALQLSYDRRAVGPVAQLCPDETVSLITFCLQIVFTVAERSREVIRLSAEIAVLSISDTVSFGLTRIFLPFTIS